MASSRRTPDSTIQTKSISVSSFGVTDGGIVSVGGVDAGPVIGADGNVGSAGVEVGDIGGVGVG